jgi:hypothetical protein
LPIGASPTAESKKAGIAGLFAVHYSATWSLSFRVAQGLAHLFFRVAQALAHLFARFA